MVKTPADVLIDEALRQHSLPASNQAFLRHWTTSLIVLFRAAAAINLHLSKSVPSMYLLAFDSFCLAVLFAD